VDLRQSVDGPHPACGSIGLMREQEDWYAYLNIATDTPTDQIEQAVEKLSRQAAALAVTAPERSQRLRDTVRAIKRDLLSGPEARARYDAGRDAGSVPPPPPPAMPSAAPTMVPPPPTGAPPPAWFSQPFPPPPGGPSTPGGPPASGPAEGGAAGGAPAGGGQPSWGQPGGGQPGGGPAAGGQPGWGQPGGGPGGGGQAGGWQGGGGPMGGPPAGGGPAGEKMSARLARFLRTGWVCGECGKEALPSEKFCTRCGSTISPTRHENAPQPARVVCANCAAPVGTNDAFCARCGTRVPK